MCAHVHTQLRVHNYYYYLQFYLSKLSSFIQLVTTCMYVRFVPRTTTTATSTATTCTSTSTAAVFDVCMYVMYST